MEPRTTLEYGRGDGWSSPAWVLIAPPGEAGEDQPSPLPYPITPRAFGGCTNYRGGLHDNQLPRDNWCPAIVTGERRFSPIRSDKGRCRGAVGALRLSPSPPNGSFPSRVVPTAMKQPGEGDKRKAPAKTPSYG
ncbi:hypothetical protein [Reticulibacter mediterranei]|uniref:hypothetical protein n=1 Tax=Reticulibacter mediterranei TaxID=2778369 RepID=UPI001C687C14|nr:hypothetical protein [Reticulibacter mediterranei]